MYKVGFAASAKPEEDLTIPSWPDFWFKTDDSGNVHDFSAVCLLFAKYVTDSLAEKRVQRRYHFRWGLHSIEVSPSISSSSLGFDSQRSQEFFSLNSRHWLLDNVNQAHLVLASGQLILQKKKKEITADTLKHWLTSYSDNGRPTISKLVCSRILLQRCSSDSATLLEKLNKWLNNSSSQSSSHCFPDPMHRVFSLL